MRSVVVNLLIAVLAFACGWLVSDRVELARAPDPIVEKEVEEVKELINGFGDGFHYVIATDGTVCKTDLQRFLGAKPGRQFRARASEWK